MAEGFVQVKKGKISTTTDKNGSYVHSKFANTPENLKDLTIKFNQKLELIRDSKVFEEIKNALVEFITKSSNNNTNISSNIAETDNTNDSNAVSHKWNLIKCLALGSPSHEPAALFQLALLQLLSESLGITKITSYDPVYTDLDKAFLTSVVKHTILDSAIDHDQKLLQLDEKNEIGKSLLYYMPHVPISLLEEILTHEAPKYLVSNDIVLYGDKWSDSEFFDKYPNTARIANIIRRNELRSKKVSDIDTTTNQKSDGDSTLEFQVVSGGKNKKNNKRKNRNKFVAPVIDYKYDEMYYDDVYSCKFLKGNDFNHPWNESFGFLRFMGLVNKIQSEEDAKTETKDELEVEV